MLSLFVTCDLLWPVEWEFHKGKPAERRKSERTASFVAPRPHDDMVRPAGFAPRGAMQRHSRETTDGGHRSSSSFGWRELAAINDLRNE
jgi:hypothetical protein